jgi:hypothetical protein
LFNILLLLPRRIYYKDANHRMLPVTPQLIDRFKAGLARCFKAALDAGALSGNKVVHVSMQYAGHSPQQCRPCLSKD